MKKALEKDKKLRFQIKKIEAKHFVLKLIFKNLSFSHLIRWNAFLKLKDTVKNNSKVAVTNKCLWTQKKKRYNKLTNFSRHAFLKLIRSGSIAGMQKSSG